MELPNHLLYKREELPITTYLLLPPLTLFSLHPLGQAPYPPLELVLAGRVSINANHHFVINVKCHSEEVLRARVCVVVVVIGSY